MRRYELMLLLRPDLDDDRLQSAVEKVTRAIVNAGGSLSKVSPWGKRRLAYEISHQREASYFLIHFDIEPGAVRGIERGLLISEEILRHLVTLIDERAPVRSGDGDRRPRPAARAEPESAVEADGTAADVDAAMPGPEMDGDVFDETAAAAETDEAEVAAEVDDEEQEQADAGRM